MLRFGHGKEAIRNDPGCENTGRQEDLSNCFHPDQAVRIFNGMEETLNARQ